VLGLVRGLPANELDVGQDSGLGEQVAEIDAPGPVTNKGEASGDSESVKRREDAREAEDALLMVIEASDEDDADGWRE
jgi:hypothetical protein